MGPPNLVTIAPIYYPINRLYSSTGNEQVASRILGKQLFVSSANYRRHGSARKIHKIAREGAMLSHDLDDLVSMFPDSVPDQIEKKIIPENPEGMLTYNSVSQFWPMLKSYVRKNPDAFWNPSFFEQLGYKIRQQLSNDRPVRPMSATVDLEKEDKYRQAIFYELTKEMKIIQRVVEALTKS